MLRIIKKPLLLASTALALTLYVGWPNGDAYAYDQNTYRGSYSSPYSFPIPLRKPLKNKNAVIAVQDLQKGYRHEQPEKIAYLEQENGYHSPVITDAAAYPVPERKPSYFHPYAGEKVEVAMVAFKPPYPSRKPRANEGNNKSNYEDQNFVQKFYAEKVATRVDTVVEKIASNRLVDKVANFAWGFSSNKEQPGYTKDQDPHRITDNVIPWASIQRLDIPKRPSPVFELGEPYFQTGPMGEGFEIFTGARWRPGLMIFGQLRTALQSFENQAGDRVNELVNRLDLFANLRLTGTERILASFRPLDQDGEFTGYDLDEGSFESRFNGDLLTLFFEGDFDQLFPDWLNPTGMESNDYSFSVGKQPVFIQEGFLVNDVLESIALANNNIHIPGIANAHSTFLFAWDDVNRNDNQETDAQLWGLFSEIDLRKNRMQFDVSYVDADEEDGGDGFYTGLSSFQRIGEVWTTLRMNNSWALDEENAQVSDGTLLFTEVSWEPDRTNDIAYFNSFWAIDNYAVAANDVAGPLGDVGILFAAKNIGAFGAPVANDANDAYGFAFGYQHMFNNFRSQIIGEIAYRADNEPEHSHTTAFGLSFEQAIGQHIQLFIDAFAADNSDQDDLATGLRTEISVKF